MYAIAQLDRLCSRLEGAALAQNEMMMSTYNSIVFGFVRGIFLLVAALALLYALVAALDMFFGLQWGLNWQIVLIGVPMAIGLFAGYLTTTMIAKFVQRSRPE